jgi:hypothetical protein
MKIPEHVLARLRSQLSRGELVLFPGAGFSKAAHDLAGKALPASKELTQELWDLAFPGQPFDDTTRLGDAFAAAKTKREKDLLAFLRGRLSIGTDSLPDVYRVWFSLPWTRCYTLNLDDLALAVARRFPLPRPIRSVSATSGKTQGSKDPSALEVIHLNGGIWDDLSDMTFSDIDYGARLTTPNSWYVRCSIDVVSRPVIFVGTELDESLLWQYVEYRKGKGPRGLRDLRPGSYFVSPKINSAREYVLSDLNVDLLTMTAKEFQLDVLDTLQQAATDGHLALRSLREAEDRQIVPRLVADMAATPSSTTTEYLMGHEPVWSDLQFGRAIVREFDEEIHTTVTQILRSQLPPMALVLTGTAGSGKSTSLMRLGLRLSAEGIPCYWIDERSNIDPHRLRTIVIDSKGPLAILVDDADLWGGTLSAWARELPKLRQGVLCAFALRSTKVEGLLDVNTLLGADIHEMVMPVLSDVDIEELVRVLDANNRLGVLKGQPHVDRVAAFKRETGAGRQLLVAMINATSGPKFRDKVFLEFKELSDRQRLLYGIVAFTHSQRYSINRDELLLATGLADNETLNAIESLVRRHLGLVQQ